MLQICNELLHGHNMIRIPKNHLLGHSAVIEVCAILNKAGAVAESIKNDYGEDIIVQTQLNEIADNFSIFIQIKGTNLKRTKKGDFPFKIDIEHALRWTSHMHPVLVCVYDETSGNTYAFYPRRVFSIWDLSTKIGKSTTVRLNSDNLFDVSTAKKIYLGMSN